jgi:hypothetical protein
MSSNTVDSPEQQIAEICTENAAGCSPLQRNATVRTEVARAGARIEPYEFDDMLRRAWEVLEARARLERQGRSGAMLA